MSTKNLPDLTGCIDLICAIAAQWAKDARRSEYELYHLAQWLDMPLHEVRERCGSSKKNVTLQVTIAVVAELQATGKTVTYDDIARRLGRNKDTACRRVGEAARLGYLAIQQEKAGTAASITLNSPHQD